MFIPLLTGIWMEGDEPVSRGRTYDVAVVRTAFLFTVSVFLGLHYSHCRGEKVSCVAHSVHGSV